MSARVERAYLVGVAAGATGTRPEITGVLDDEQGWAMALGAVHGRLGAGYPLPRAEVLAEVAELRGETPATPSDGPDHNASWLDGWAKGAASVCDALEARLIGGMTMTAREDLTMFVVEQRKAAGK